MRSHSTPRSPLAVVLVVILLAGSLPGLACRSTMPFPTPTPTRVRPTRTPELVEGGGSPGVPVSPVPVHTPVGTLIPPVDLTPLTANALGAFAQPSLRRWRERPYAGVDYSLPLTLAGIANAPVTNGLTKAQRTFLEENGFVVVHTQEAQFHGIRQRVALYYGQPYFLTTDAAYHALHVTFDDLLKALEREELRPRMITLLQATLDETLSYLPYVQGTEVEADTRLAAAYLGVGLRLFDPEARLDPQIEEAVRQQLSQIDAGGGQAPSVLLPGFEDDYGAYRPVGHYAGDTELEAYFRGMTWLGRVHFSLQPANGEPPSRTPLIITLALRRAPLGELSAADTWVDVHETLTFLIGPSDDSGPAEYARLMDQVYGKAPSLLDLPRQDKWQDFLRLSAVLPPPQINSTFVTSLQDLAEAGGWRFLGQRFTLDNLVLQNMVYDQVGDPKNKRKLPSGLDVMAALGSEPALDALEQAGETRYANYMTQLERLRAAAEKQPEAQWLDTAFGAWLFSFMPQLAPKGEEFPAFMRQPAWGYKDLNSALGSWAELKHDTVLYAKMPEFAGGGGPPSSPAAPAYVEPNPPVFYRLAFVAEAVVQGLMVHGMTGDESLSGPQSLSELLQGMEQLSNRLKALGDLAERELRGEELATEDYETILASLGPVEQRVVYMQRMARFGVGTGDEMPPVPVVAAVAGAEDQVLQVAVGRLDRIYVVVPIGGQLQIAQGGVFSYYEFPGQRDKRLTDAEWQSRVAGAPPPSPAWVRNFRLLDGAPTDYLAFRTGDYYIITEAGANLNVRSSPSRQADILHKLQPGTYVLIQEGPVQADGYTWWKVFDEYSEQPAGWVVEHQGWYERAWGQ